jgi:hypothetical protein
MYQDFKELLSLFNEHKVKYLDLAAAAEWGPWTLIRSPIFTARPPTHEACGPRPFFPDISVN